MPNDRDAEVFAAEVLDRKDEARDELVVVDLAVVEVLLLTTLALVDEVTVMDFPAAANFVSYSEQSREGTLT